MGFIHRNNNLRASGDKKTSFYKRKTAKTIYVIAGFLLIVGISFFGYLYATSSKIFDNGAGFSPFLKMIKGEQSDILKQERINIVFFGRGGDNHPGGLLTDSIMLVSIETKTNQIALVNIPRDLLVPIKGHGKAKINEAYADGYNDYMAKNCGKKNSPSNCRNEAYAAGANLSSETISTVTGIPVSYYVSADFTGFEKFIDSLGGIDVYVDKAIYDPLYPADDMKGYEPFRVKAGQQHFNGETALKYARSRETSSDFDRSRRQQQILQATKDKASSLGILSDPTKLLNMINIVSEHVRTNLSPDEIKALAEFVRNIDKSKIQSHILSTDGSGPLTNDSSSGTYYIVTKTGDYKELQKYFQNIFKEDVVSEDADIEILNGSKVSGLGGKLADFLKDEGYSVANIANAKESYKKTVIYDYSNGKMKDTLKFLKDSLDAEVLAKTDATKKIDISVIIGDDYKGITIKN